MPLSTLLPSSLLGLLLSIELVNENPEPFIFYNLESRPNTEKQISFFQKISCKKWNYKLRPNRFNYGLLIQNNGWACLLWILCLGTGYQNRHLTTLDFSRLCCLRLGNKQRNKKDERFLALRGEEGILKLFEYFLQNDWFQFLKSKVLIWKEKKLIELNPIPG